MINDRCLRYHYALDALMMLKEQDAEDEGARPEPMLVDDGDVVDKVIDVHKEMAAKNLRGDSCAAHVSSNWKTC